MISTQVADSSHHIHRHEVDDRFWPKAAAGTPSHDVRYWPKADIGRRVRPNLNVAASAWPPASASSLLSRDRDRRHPADRVLQPLYELVSK